MVIKTPANFQPMGKLQQMEKNFFKGDRSHSLGSSIRSLFFISDRILASKTKKKKKKTGEKLASCNDVEEGGGRGGNWPAMFVL